jgi:hypothetical protein
MIPRSEALHQISSPAAQVPDTPPDARSGGAPASAAAQYQSPTLQEIAAIIRQEVQPIRTTIASFDKRLNEMNGKIDGKFSGMENKVEDIDMIPRQLVLTAKHGSLDDLPLKVQYNVRQTLALNPGLRLRWLDDDACGDFILDHFGSDLLSLFNRQREGKFRGDICRAAVVAVEGGFYVDLDVQMRVPFSQLVDNMTTFMAVKTPRGDILNAIFAAERGSEVMRAVVAALEAWLVVEKRRYSGLLGPETMMAGLQEVVKRDCPSVDLRRLNQLQQTCGRHHQIRLYQERWLECRPGSVECPPPRNTSNTSFLGLRYGIFEPGPQGTLVAWSRFAGCTSWGCDAGGADRNETSDDDDDEDDEDGNEVVLQTPPAKWLRAG